MTAPASAGHRPGLDSVRGVAVVAVLTYHLGHLDGGFLGVDLFFVLSGYLICDLLLGDVDRAGRPDLRRFWLRRVRRLVPALVAMVAVTCAAALALGWPSAGREALWHQGLATVASVGNWEQIVSRTDYWAPGPGPFRHAWSLGVEEQFYLLWPLLVLAACALASRAGRPVRTVVAAVAGAGVALSVLAHAAVVAWGGPDRLSVAYLSTPTRVLAPLAGCWLAAVAHGRTRSRRGDAAARAAGLAGVVGLAALVAASAVDDPGTFERMTIPLAALASVGIVAGAATLERAEQLTGALGRRAYGLYLWSWPIQVLVQREHPDLSATRSSVLVLALSLVAAEVSLRVLEDPLRYGTGWAAEARARRAGWAATVSLAAIALVSVATSATPAPPSAEAARAEAAGRPAVEPGAEHQSAPTVPAGMLANRPLRVAVVGDSVAWALADHVPDPLPASLALVDNRALVGCGLLGQMDGAGWEASVAGGPFEATPGGDSCSEARAMADERVLAGRPDVVLVGYGAWEAVPFRPADGGEVIEPQSNEATGLMVGRLRDRIAPFVDAGVAVRLLPWVCPGPAAVADQREPGYDAWYRSVLEAVAASSPLVRVVALPAEVCGPDGATAAALTARPDGIHWDDDWPWVTWLPDAIATA